MENLKNLKKSITHTNGTRRINIARKKMVYETDARMETSVRKSQAWLVGKLGVSVSPAWHVTKLPRLKPRKITVVHTALRHESRGNSYRGSLAIPLTLIHFNAIWNLILLLLFGNYVHVNAYCREITTVRCKTKILQSWQFRFSANYGMIQILLHEARYSLTSM